ncbi:MAG: 50S ribosomal protein L29 [Bdellovibrionales bacterium]|nr:50S ribosomal protein L29 [Bdellovibrionales bacterium]
MEKKATKEILENYRGLHLDELIQQKNKLHEDITVMRFKNKSGQLDDLGAYRRAKTNFARLQTIIEEKTRAK